MLSLADNLAWKLSLVLKGQAADPETLLDSYHIEVAETSENSHSDTYFYCRENHMQLQQSR